MRLARWLTLALFGSVSLLGPGLHLLDCRCASPPHADCAAAASARDHACGHCCHRQAAEAPAAADVPRVRSANGHDDDCLICRFFAQGQLTACETPLPTSQFAAPHRSPLAVDLPFLAALGPYQARGPPAIL